MVQQIRDELSTQRWNNLGHLRI